MAVWEALVRCERRWLWVFVLVCLTPTLTGCPDNYSYLAHTYRCYRAYGILNTYDEAVATCLADGGSLAMPRDNTTNNFLVALKNNVSTSSKFRFGLHRWNETWKYVDGGELGNFTDWAENEPNDINERCAEYLPVFWYGSKWNDGYCSTQRRFLCEAEPAVNHCQPDPCVYGTCISGPDIFTCTCDEGYEGGTCNISIGTQ
ncbi:PREDICTED: C-type lectin 1-like [Branchiostoma belcheri]|uniref:C-type lectin 1-like n=1 Tax=Branchiostoma belcheri TaxID=7741 RepID=A0A6P4YXW7_BRABE|nr:PREDICTED: C-type lectin 1-like [Branchiostoma belcheri]